MAPSCPGSLNQAAPLPRSLFLDAIKSLRYVKLKLLQEQLQENHDKPIQVSMTCHHVEMEYPGVTKFDHMPRLACCAAGMPNRPENIEGATQC